MPTGYYNVLSYLKDEERNWLSMAGLARSRDTCIRFEIQLSMMAAGQSCKSRSDLITPLETDLIEQSNCEATGAYGFFN